MGVKSNTNPRFQEENEPETPTLEAGREVVATASFLEACTL